MRTQSKTVKYNLRDYIRREKTKRGYLGGVEEAVFYCVVERTVNLESENLDSHPDSIPC